MTVTIELAPELQAELARQAATQGVGIDAYASRLIEEAAQRSGIAADKRQSLRPSPELVEAIETLKSFGKTHGLSLGGMTIRDLCHEARP
jgi:hypothetical protein